MKVSYTNFTGGEISHSLASRYDLGKFKSSCRHLENFLPDLHGPLRRRGGTRFIADLGAPAVLIPFSFSADPDQNYALVLQAGKIRIAHKGGFALGPDNRPWELATPYAESQLYDISYAQSGDMVYLAHPSHRLHKVVRGRENPAAPVQWSISPVAFMPEIGAPSSVSVKWKDLKDGSDDLEGEGGSYRLRYKVAAVDKEGRISPSAPGVLSNAKHPSDWVVGDFTKLYWPKVEGAEEYNVYRDEAGIYGLIGVVPAAEETEGGLVTFSDQRYTADTKDTPPEPDDPFNGGDGSLGNHPGLVAFHQQRLVLASTALQPQTWYASRTGSYEDFSKSKPLKDDDALEFTLASGSIDVIQWVAAFGDLLLGTAGAEYKAAGSDGGAITPSSISVREQSFWGSAKLKPLIIGNSVVHVQRQGSRVRDLCYSLERDGYAGNDLSVLAAHLVDGRVIRQWDYQQSPGSVVYAVRDDGVLLALTYLREHEIWGWSRVTTRGRFLSAMVTAGSMEDDLYVVVERTVQGQSRWYLEVFAPRWREEHGIEEAFFVDSGLSYRGDAVRSLTGLGHLEGCEIAILADGSPLPPQIVRGGSITLPSPARVVHAGLPYQSLMCPQTPEADMQEGTTLGRVRSYGASRIRLDASVGGSYGPDAETQYEFPNLPKTYGQPLVPYTGDLQFNPDIGYSPEGEIWIAQTLPLPFTIVSLILEVDIAG